MPSPTRRLTVSNVKEARELIDPVFLNSPQYICEPLGEELGCKVLLKVETQNPVRSFKGRGSDYLVSRLKNEQHIFCASAGNFGLAMAYSCRKQQVPLTVYASESASAIKISSIRKLGAEVVLYGKDFETAKEEAKRAAKKAGGRFVEDSIDLETLAGAGTIGLELLAGPEELDYILVALGNGALISGTATALKPGMPHTKVIAIQSEGAPAMVESLQIGRIVTYDTTNTIADGIAVRLPIPQTLEDMAGLVNGGILVNDETILCAMKLLHKHAGLVVEPSAAVGIAAIMENPDTFRNKTVASIICGSNVSEEQMRQWLFRS